MYQENTGELVREAALRTKGSGSPLGVDVNGFKRIMACKSLRDKQSIYVSLLVHSQEDCAQNLLIC